MCVRSAVCDSINRAGDLDLRPFDLWIGSRVTPVMGFHHANFGLPRQATHTQMDRRTDGQTDGQADTVHRLIMPPTYGSQGEGIISGSSGAPVFSPAFGSIHCVYPWKEDLVKLNWVAYLIIHTEMVCPHRILPISVLTGPEVEQLPVHILVCS